MVTKQEALKAIADFGPGEIYEALLVLASAARRWGHKVELFKGEDGLCWRELSAQLVVLAEETKARIAKNGEGKEWEE